MTDDGYKKWMKEDADRINKMCKFASKAGKVVDTKQGDPPELNADGSLKGGKDNGKADAE